MVYKYKYTERISHYNDGDNMEFAEWSGSLNLVYFAKEKKDD